jgi:hypothetical protein
MFLLNKLEKGVLTPGFSQILKAVQGHINDTRPWAGERRFSPTLFWQTLPAKNHPKPIQGTL